jgi:hypothetical protein
MNPDIFESIMRIITLFGFAIRGLGMLVAGLGAGWLTLYVYKLPESSVYVKVASVLGFSALLSVMVVFMSGNGGAFGAFFLGLGAALLLWGLRPTTDDEEE